MIKQKKSKLEMILRLGFSFYSFPYSFTFIISGCSIRTCFLSFFTTSE
ncbi:unknown [Prevotella sp. CAG:386]|nr:unknown [Prevotella sp. CAG:386]